MKRSLVLTAIASMTLLASPALSQGRSAGQPGGRIGNPDGGLRGRSGGTDVGTAVRSDMGTGSRMNSRATVRASERAHERANENSAVLNTEGSRGNLRGVTVQRPNGATVGTIVGVHRAPDGAIRAVEVRLEGSDRVINVPREALARRGDVVVITRRPGSRDN